MTTWRNAPSRLPLQANSPARSRDPEGPSRPMPRPRTHWSLLGLPQCLRARRHTSGGSCCAKDDYALLKQTATLGPSN
jgi:hypothetical protein